LLIGLLGAQLKTNYEKVEFGEDVKALLLNVTMRYFGTHSALFCVAAFCKVQDDVEKRGGRVELEMSDHGHFVSSQPSAKDIATHMVHTLRFTGMSPKPL
jgi:hypothetical protein